jgi:hypothetical protein
VGVEVGGRLVGDQQFGIVDQGAADGDALLLAAGEPFDLGRAAVAELEPGQQFLGAREQFLARLPAGRVGGQDDVVQRREALDQVELLEDEAEAAAADLGQEALGQARDVLAVQPHAALGRPCQAADQSQQRGLARAAGAAQAVTFLRLDVQVDAVERPVLVVAALVEGLADELVSSIISASHHRIGVGDRRLPDRHQHRRRVGHHGEEEQRRHLQAVDLQA